MTPSAFGYVIIAGSLAASVGALYLLQYLYARRNKPGAGWFMGNMASVAVFCFSYGIGLLVFDPTLRIVFGSISFIAMCFMGPFFLAFGLDYTGRGDLIRTPPFGIVALVPLLSVVLTVTNPIHGFLWTDFQFDPIFGLATVTYTVQPWGIFALLFSIATAAVGSLLLIGAILSYGPLYRREATAVLLSTVPPTVGVSIWLFEIGPIPQLHLTAPLMLIHVILDAYAFVGTHMFETNPATQRMAERTGLDSLSDPVLIIDTEQQIVRANKQAEATLLDPATTSFPVPLEAALGVTIDELRATEEFSLNTNGSEVFAVSYTPLTDPSDELVGSMLVLYNVTEQRQRRQQLAVLNRVLRHNLRNETTVINGYAELLKSEIDNPQHAEQAATIEAAGNRLSAIAEKAESFEDIQRRTSQPEDISLSDLVAEIEQACISSHSDATVDWTVTSPNITIHTDRVLLYMLLKNLVENAIIHSESDRPTAQVTVSRLSEASSEACFEIRDTNDPIPDHEIDVLRAGEETPLQHGQGIGLWIVYWCVQKLHATIDFEYDNGNIITVTVPSKSHNSDQPNESHTKSMSATGLG